MPEISVLRLSTGKRIVRIVPSGRRSQQIFRENSRGRPISFGPRFAAHGTRFSNDLTSRRANALRVTLRRDGATNPRLALFFGPVLGKTQNDVRTQATAWVPPALGVLPEAELIPYVAQVDYFNAAAG